MDLKAKVAIDFANRRLKKGKLDSADGFFDKAWDYLNGNKDLFDDDLNYINKEWGRFNKSKKIRLNCLLSEAEYHAGRGDVSLVCDYIVECANLGKNMEENGLLSRVDREKILDEIDHLGNLMHQVSIPVCLAAAGHYKNIGDIKRMDLCFKASYVSIEKLKMVDNPVIEGVLRRKSD